MRIIGNNGTNLQRKMTSRQLTSGVCRPVYDSLEDGKLAEKLQENVGQLRETRLS